jgi:hypothetical protein
MTSTLVILKLPNYQISAVVRLILLLQLWDTPLRGRTVLNCLSCRSGHWQRQRCREAGSYPDIAHSSRNWTEAQTYNLFTCGSQKAPEVVRSVGNTV